MRKQKSAINSLRLVAWKEPGWNLRFQELEISKEESEGCGGGQKSQPRTDVRSHGKDFFAKRVKTAVLLGFWAKNIFGEG
jgi:hypothetical protein